MREERKVRGKRRSQPSAPRSQSAGVSASMIERISNPPSAGSQAASPELHVTYTALPRNSYLVALGSRARDFLRRQDWTLWLLVLIVTASLLPRIYGINWDDNNHLHPDERAIVFAAMCLTLPGAARVGCSPAYTGPGWFLSPQSPLNPHFFAYGSFPLYLLAAVAHALAGLTQLTHGRFLPPDSGVWDDYNHFTLVGRAISALFDTGSVLLAGLLARRLGGRIAGLLAAGFVATIPFDVQVSHFYAVDTLLLFFVLLTLYGCVLLVQSLQDTFHIFRFWVVGLFIGVAFGLAMATKVSALPLVVPIGVALLLCWRRHGPGEALLALVGIGASALVTFIITSPYALIDWTDFYAAVTQQVDLSRGQLDYPYVLQFTGTTPYVYEITQLLLYDMGLPLGLLGLAGFGWALSRLWRGINSDWAIIVSFVVVYFAVVGSAYTKFSRYMLPVFAPLAICGACAIVAWASWGSGRVLPALRLWQRRLAGRIWWRAIWVGVAVAVLVASLIFTLGIDSIYSTPMTRVVASEWIYNHIPAGSSITDEIWDDPLPIMAPAASTNGVGQGYTQEGHLIDPSEYHQIGLSLYDPDTMAKAQQLSSQLAAANVVVISSQRLIDSIPKLPDRYPMASRYYTLLFSGQLGFKLAAHFEEHPHFLGFVLSESGADESFSVYDHPPVWIFTRVGNGLSQSALLQKLTAGINLSETASRTGAQKSLLLSATDAQADQQSLPLSVQFSPQSLANQIPLLWWLLFVELLGLIAFPLTYSVLPGLRDRGWGFSKLIGLLVLAYMIWLPASLSLLPFDHSVVVAALLVLAAISGLLAWWRRRQLLAFVRERWKLLVIGEIVFLVAFFFFTWIRALDPDLWHIYRGGEKPMELAFLDAILRSRYMPPYDPWFSGGYINYYYYGQYLVAVLIKLTGIVPTTAFNLAIPLLFALTATAAYSVVLGLTRRWWAGIAGSIALIVVCNLDGLWQTLNQLRSWLSGLPVPAFDYWQSSRVIPCAQISGVPLPNCAQTTINEFPFWSFLYADLHAHVIDLPIVVLIVGCCASLILSAHGDRARWWRTAPTLAVIALALGTAWCTNTWDVPTYGGLVAITLALWALPLGAAADGDCTISSRLTWPVVRGYLVSLGLTLAATYLLFFPFHANYQDFVTGLGTATVSTDPVQFFTLFGIWLFLIVSFLVVELHDRFEEERLARELDPAGSTGRLFWLLGIGGLILAIAFIISLKAILLLLIGVALYLALDRRHSPLKVMTYLFLLLGLIIALGVEFFYVRDFLDGTAYFRMNTVFKFYYQVWTFFALGGALIFTQLVVRLPGLARWYSTATDELSVPSFLSLFGPSFLRLAWIAGLVALLVGSSIFVVSGTQARLADPQIWAEVQPPPGGIQPTTLSLDGMAYMRGWYPGDYAAINWINEHISGDPTIVEASDGNYYWYSRVSIYTGLPDVLGWGSREYEQRYGAEVFPRQSDVQSFWGESDPTAALSFLRQYHVAYVYVGQLERTCYVMQDNGCVSMSTAALDKFNILQSSGALRIVYQNNDVTLYKVTG